MAEWTPRMHPRVSILFSLPILLAGSGCAPATEEEAAGTPVGGKADFAEPGEVSSPFADPSVSYLSRRSISKLKEVAALTPLQSGVIDRVDGIRANTPSDGYLDLQELVAASTGDNFRAFLEEEQEQFPFLFSLLEIGPESVEATPVPDVAEPVDLSTPPGEVEFPVVQIEDLPEEIQSAARRLQRVHDHDDTPATVTMADVEAGLASPGPFTEDELDALERVRSWLWEHSSVDPGRARVRVPEIGESSWTILERSGLQIVRRRTVEIRETRSGESYAIGTRITRPIPVVVNLRATVDESLHFHVPEGTTAVLFQEAHRGIEETERHMSTSQPWGGRVGPWGPIAVELWRNGERIDHFRTHFSGTVLRPTTRDLSRFADYDLELPDGTPLHRNVVQTVDGHSRYPFEGRRVEYVYRSEDEAPPADASSALVDRFSTPAPAMEPGLYRRRVHGSVFELEVYGNGVMRSRFFHESHLGTDRAPPRERMELVGGTTLNGQPEIQWSASHRETSTGLISEHPIVDKHGSVQLPSGQGRIRLRASDRL